MIKYCLIDDDNNIHEFDTPRARDDYAASQDESGNQFEKGTLIELLTQHPHADVQSTYYECSIDDWYYYDGMISSELDNLWD